MTISLTDPFPFYSSTFNDYTWWGNLWGEPGLINAASVTSLLNNLADLNTRNFFFNGHGDVTSIGNGSGGDVHIGKNTVGDRLRNRYTLHSKTPERNHPYRFVFLFACDTAGSTEWSQAFGILDKITPSQADAKPGRVQAFLGFKGKPPSPGNADNQGWYDNAIMLATFFNSWMNLRNLQQCIADASNPSLAWPINMGWTNPDARRNYPFKLVTYGYPWIRRQGHDHP